MKRSLGLIIVLVGLGLLASCATRDKGMQEGLTAGEIFQRAQDAVDRGDYAHGIEYYAYCQKQYPDDVAHDVWASYEIAFIYHKMGQNAKAIELFNELLARYEKEGSALPPAPQVLAQKLKARLEDASKKKS